MRQWRMSSCRWQLVQPRQPPACATQRSRSTRCLRLWCLLMTTRLSRCMCRQGREMASPTECIRGLWGWTLLSSQVGAQQ